METEYEEGTSDLLQYFPMTFVPVTMENVDTSEYAPKAGTKASNILPLWGNERSMNLNPLILTNIQSSHYFKVNLYELKTYHEVVDEIYYQVSHLEPWEKGSRRTSGQTGMCGGVRGVGAGGIVSTAYCLLYKLFTLKLTRKQLNGLLTHCDSPYIRALGFMYIRYTQHPQNLLDWFDPYLEDEEELDVKAGGGQMMSIGQMLRQWLIKLEWFSTLFPRIPVPIQQKLQTHLQERFPDGILVGPKPVEADPPARNASRRYDDKNREERSGGDGSSFLRDRSRGDFEPEKRDRYRGNHDYDRIRERSRDRSSRHHHSKHRHRHSTRDRSRSRERDRHSREKDHKTSKSKSSRR